MASPPSAAPLSPAQAAPQSMEELAEMLREAQAGSGPAGFGGAEGFPGFGGPAGLPQLPGGGSNVIPAAFGKRNKKKK